MTEKQIQTEILNNIGSRPDVRLFRNNVGVMLDSSRPIRFGLCKGSSDLIGIQKIKITPEMVGKEIGQFISIEVKSEKGKPTKEQKLWLEMIHRFGGKAFIARSVEESEYLLQDVFN